MKGYIEWSGTIECFPLIELKEDGTFGKVSWVPYKYRQKGKPKLVIE